MMVYHETPEHRILHLHRCAKCQHAVVRGVDGSDLEPEKVVNVDDKLMSIEHRCKENKKQKKPGKGELWE